MNLECQKFLEKPFADYYPDSWYYNYVLTPFCGKPNYEKEFSCLDETNKKKCMDMVEGKTRFIKTRFIDDCLCKSRQLISRRIETVKKTKKPISGWKRFFSSWKKTSEETERDILIPLLEHKENLEKQVKSGHGLFLLVGNAFLLHTFPNIVVYDPFFDHRHEFDIDWFGKITNLPGSFNVFNVLYSHLLPFIYFGEEKEPNFAWKPERDNFDNFQFVIRGETLFVKVKSEVAEITRQYSLKNKDFFVLPLLMHFKSAGKHLNLLVYDFRKQTWEHFESNGYIWFMSDYIDDYLEEKLPKLILDENEPDGKLKIKKY